MQNQKCLTYFSTAQSYHERTRELKRNFAHTQIFTLKNCIGYFEGIDNGPVIKLSIIMALLMPISK